jgi:multiple sugar transport system permease protein
MTVSSTAPAAEVETSALAPRHRGKPPLSEGARAERKLAFLLCAPAVIIMVAVTAYPIGYALWLSLQRYDLRFPADRAFAGLSNYVAVLSSGYWWSAFGITLLITVVSVAIEFVLGLALALVMHRTIMGRGLTRTVVLIPYGIVTVVAAFSWQFAWTPETGYLANMLPAGSAPLTGQASAIMLIIIAEVWKTTPFMALLLLAGLALVPDELHEAAKVDGASAWQRFWRITIPLMRPAILVALLFRTLDAWRIFDNIYIIQPGGALNTESVSILGYNVTINRVNVGLGSAISILIFISVILIAIFFVKALGTSTAQQRGEAK